MKKFILARIANTAVALSLFAAVISVGTASMWGMHQPKVPKSLLK